MTWYVTQGYDYSVDPPLYAVWKMPKRSTGLLDEIVFVGTYEECLLKQEEYQNA